MFGCKLIPACHLLTPSIKQYNSGSFYLHFSYPFLKHVSQPSIQNVLNLAAQHDHDEYCVPMPYIQC